MKTIDDIILREGGFVDHPSDRGGPTNMGITQKALSKFLGRKASLLDVKHMERETAVVIYENEYINEPRFDQIVNDRLRDLVIDAGVHHGQGQSSRLLQRAAKVKDDGKIGPVSLAAINAGDPEFLYDDFLARRIRLIGIILEKDHSQATFAAGWLDRMADFLSPN